MKNNKGFTLIELLTIFILLGIVAGIAYTLTDKNKQDAKEQLVKVSAKKLFTIIDNYYADLGFKDFPTEGVYIDTLEIETTSFTGGKIKLDVNGDYTLENVTDGTYCINGTLEKLKIVKGECIPVSGTPVSGAVKAYIVALDPSGKNIIGIDSIPDTYNLINPTNIFAIYLDENDKVLKVSRGIISKEQNKSTIETIKNQLKATMCDANPEVVCDSHYYISSMNSFSYIMFQNLCQEGGLNLCEGNTDIDSIDSLMGIEYNDLTKISIGF